MRKRGAGHADCDRGARSLVAGARCASGRRQPECGVWEAAQQWNMPEAREGGAADRGNV